MSDTQANQELHDRATRGATLSDDERSRLNEWYLRLDQAEKAVLEANSSEPSHSLREQLEHAASELVSVSQQIQKVTHENENLRREIAMLSKQLANRLRAQPV